MIADDAFGVLLCEKPSNKETNTLKNYMEKENEEHLKRGQQVFC